MTKMFQKESLEKAYVLIKCKADLEPYVLKYLERISGVQRVEYTVGAGCVLLGIMAGTLEGLQETICSKIQKIPQIYSTSVILCGQTCMKEGEIYE